MGFVKVFSSLSNNFKLKMIVYIKLIVLLLLKLPFPEVSGATFSYKTNSIFQALKCCASTKKLM